MKAGLVQQRAPGCLNQVLHEGKCQSDDVALDIRREAEAVDAHARHHDDQRPLERMDAALQLELDPAPGYVQQVNQVGMAVGMDMPGVERAAFRDRLAVEQVGGGPVVRFTVELEDRNGGRPAHESSLSLRPRSNLNLPKVQMIERIMPYSDSCFIEKYNSHSEHLYTKLDNNGASP